MKDKEFNDLLYQNKSRNGSSPIKRNGENEIERESRNQLYTLEENAKSKSKEMSWLEYDKEYNEVSSFVFLNYT